MRILLIGKTGQLGGDLLRNGAGHEIVAPDRSELDVERRESVEEAVRRYGPDAVINTAAFHNVPLCESDPAAAFRINCVAVRDLALACRSAGAWLVTLSTDYVFGGEKGRPYAEDDPPSPLQMYGISKLAGEYAARSAAPERAVIVRSCGLYGISGAKSKGGNFVDKRIADAESGGPLEMGCDQVVSPTSTDDLSKAILKLLAHPSLAPGIYHLVNEGECSWYEFTKEIYAILRLPAEVRPVDRGGLTGALRRPRYSVLENAKAAAMGVRLPRWRDGLKRYLDRRCGGPPPPRGERRP